MLTDAEIDTLAREILTQIVTLANSWTTVPAMFDEIQTMESGELIPVYSATSEEGDGSFICWYMPLEAIKKIIPKCERMYDAFLIEVTDKQTGKSAKTMLTGKTKPEHRDPAIRTMAECATMHLITSFRGRLGDLLIETLKDSELMAESVLSAVLAKQLTKELPAEVTADMRSEIEKAAERVADKKRALLRGHIGKLPNIMAERGRGRIPKSDFERKQESKIYRQNVETAYRKVRTATGKTRIKALVAKELGEGGVNPKTGIDSSLQAFRLKLERLEIDYNEIAQKIEAELNNNS